jgi:transposase
MLESARLEGVASAGGRAAEGAVGDRSGSAGGCVPSVGVVADPELVERPRRRRFSAEYKLRIVRAADGCTRPGEIGALLRREGLYSSLLTEWRRARDSGALGALAPKQRGRRGPSPAEVEVQALRRRLDRTQADLETARRVIEVQGNVSALLEELLAKGASETGGRQRQR